MFRKSGTGKPKSKNENDLSSIFFLYSVDPDEAAYYQTIDKVRQFQERVLDKHFDGMVTTRRGKVLRELKRTMKYKDKESVKHYLQEYAQLDGTAQGLKSSLKAMNPLFGLSNAEKAQFLKWISEDDKKYLHKAEKYYRELLSGLNNK